MRRLINSILFVAVLASFGCAAVGLRPAKPQPALPPLDETFKATVQYQYGQSREPLTTAESRVRAALADPAARVQCEDQLRALLKSSDATSGAKEFACRQLAIIGTARCVPDLASMLNHKDLSTMARYALEQVPGPEASRALREGLGKSEGAVQVGIVNSIGVRRDRKAVASLAHLLRKGGPEVAGASAAALGKIGSLRAAWVLGGAMGRTSAASKTDVAEAYLLAADRLEAGDHPIYAARIYREVYSSKQPLHIRTTALEGLMRARPSEGLKHVVEMLKGSDPVAQEDAVWLARRTTGAESTKILCKTLTEVTTPVQVALLGALADRGDRAALPAATAATKNENAEVRVAALRAAGRLGDASVVPLLASVAATGTADEKTAAGESLSRLAGEGVDAAILEQVDKAEPKVRAALVSVLAARGSSACVPKLMDLAADPEAQVRVAALKALGDLAGAEQYEQMLKLLAGAQQATEKAAAEKATLAVAGRIDGEDQKVNPLLALLTSGSSSEGARGSALNVLAGLGGAKALDAVRAAYKDPSEPVRDAAVRAMAGWADAAPMADLKEIAAKGATERQQAMAMRGYIRMIGLPSSRSASENALLYREALGMTPRAEEKRLVLAGLASTPDAESWKTIQPLLTDPELGAEARAAALAILPKLANVQSDLVRKGLEEVLKAGASDQDLADKVAMAMLETAGAVCASSPAEAEAMIGRALTITQAKEARDQAEKTRVNIENLKDYVIGWQMAGPYKLDGKEGNEHFDVVFDPEKPDVKVGWQLISAGNNAQAYHPWAVDLGVVFGKVPGAAYLRTAIWSPKEQSAALQISSDDGVKVWFNGQIVDAINAGRSIMPKQDVVSVTLNKGWNRVMMKVINGAGDWGGALRVRGPQDEHLEGLRFSPEPTEEK